MGSLKVISVPYDGLSILPQSDDEFARAQQIIAPTQLLAPPGFLLLVDQFLNLVCVLVAGLPVELLIKVNNL
jgi:hypothetical protein